MAAIRGKYTKEEEALIAQVEPLKGKTTWVSEDWSPDNMYPVENRRITPDFINSYCIATGEVLNPLWRNEQYAKGTRWGVNVAPPMAITKVAAACGQPHFLRFPESLARRVAVFDAGATYRFSKPIRLGDYFKVQDVWYTGFEDKTRKDGTGDRQFLATSDRIYYNQNDDLVCVVKRRRMYVIYDAPKAGEAFGMVAQIPKFIEYPYTFEELEDLIDPSIIIDGDEDIRGAESRYWEDVKVGDEPKLMTYQGFDKWSQTTICQSSMVGKNVKRMQDVAKKSDGLDKVLFRPDPRTNLPSYIGSVIIDDPVAPPFGITLALALGVEIDMLLCHLITNWMGNDGVLKRFDTQHRTWAPREDSWLLKGKVIKKYQEDGEHLVDMAVWAQSIRGYIASPSNCTVVLPSREAALKAYQKL
ncbi:MaoC family dehydratase N-terminal domain-containing protein [Chloroflexota bacterium]